MLENKELNDAVKPQSTLPERLVSVSEHLDQSVNKLERLASRLCCEDAAPAEDKRNGASHEGITPTHAMNRAVSEMDHQSSRIDQCVAQIEQVLYKG